jgi:pimeloyl-ACP methyl ester carboxylesterase
MAYLASQRDIDKRKVFFFGRSLGGAVAVRTAVNHPHEVRRLSRLETRVVAQHFQLLVRRQGAPWFFPRRSSVQHRRFAP